MTATTRMLWGVRCERDTSGVWRWKFGQRQASWYQTGSHGGFLRILKDGDELSRVCCPNLEVAVAWCVGYATGWSEALTAYMQGIEEKVGDQ